MHMHMFMACSQTTQPSHRNPGSAMSAELSVGNVTNKQQKGASHGERPFFCVRETIGILK